MQFQKEAPNQEAPETVGPSQSDAPNCHSTGWFIPSMGAEQSSISQGDAPAKGLHVLRVTPQSPASETDIEPFFDFVVGFEGATPSPGHRDIDVTQLEKIVESHEGKVLNLLVWSSKNQNTRGRCRPNIDFGITLTALKWYLWFRRVSGPSRSSTQTRSRLGQKMYSHRFWVLACECVNQNTPLRMCGMFLTFWKVALQKVLGWYQWVTGFSVRVSYF